MLILTVLWIEIIGWKICTCTKLIILDEYVEVLCQHEYKIMAVVSFFVFLWKCKVYLLVSKLNILNNLICTLIGKMFKSMRK